MASTLLDQTRCVLLEENSSWGGDWAHFFVTPVHAYDGILPPFSLAGTVNEMRKKELWGGWGGGGNVNSDL